MVKLDILNPAEIFSICQSFLKELPNSHADRLLVEIMILMVHELGLDVVAEGVETQQQVECLQELGCQYVQGFLLDRPAKNSWRKKPNLS